MTLAERGISLPKGRLSRQSKAAPAPTSCISG